MVSTSQVRGLEERLWALEKTLQPSTGTLSAAASGDLRLLHQEIQGVKDRQSYEGEAIKDLRSLFMTLLASAAALVTAAILGVIWQLFRIYEQLGKNKASTV